MNLLKKISETVMSIQIIMLILFIILNIDNLDDIEFDYILDEETTTYSINFYTLLSALFGIMILGIITSFSIFGGGLNDEGSKLLMKYLALGLLIAILFIASVYFLLPVGLVGVLINIMFLLGYAFWIINELISGGSE